MKLIDRSILLDVLWRSDCSTREKIDEIVNRQYVYKDMISIDDLLGEIRCLANRAIEWETKVGIDDKLKSFMLGEAHACSVTVRILENKKGR